MFKKINFDQEIIHLKEKGIKAVNGSITKCEIFITTNNDEIIEYKFNSVYKYNKFNHAVRKIQKNGE